MGKFSDINISSLDIYRISFEKFTHFPELRDMINFAMREDDVHTATKEIIVLAPFRFILGQVTMQ